jgi:hypothetical protein
VLVKRNNKEWEIKEKFSKIKKEIEVFENKDLV